MSGGARKVAVLTSVHPPFDPRVYHKEARTLAAAGYEVTLVAPHDRDEVADGVRVRGIAMPSGRLQRVLSSPLRVLREALRIRADVYHFHDPELLPVGLALKLLGRRVVYDAHEEVPKSILEKAYLPSWLRRPLATVAGGLEKGMSQAFDLVVAASEGIRESFGDHRRVVLLRNYPMRAQFQSVEHVERADGDFVVAYTGALTAVRGAREMVEAIGKVPERCRARMVVCGRYFPEELEKSVRSMPAFSRVEYRGVVPFDDIPSILARVDAGLVCILPAPNHLNAGPNKLFEYMAAGLPVVASNFPAWRDIVEGNDCGICVDPSDPTAIASAFERLADQPERRREMGANGRRAVLDKYNWEAESRGLLEAYSRLLPELPGQLPSSPAGGGSR